MSLLLTPEVARILRRSVPSINRDRMAGRLPFIRLGRSIRFDAEVVERIAAEGYPVETVRS